MIPLHRSSLLRAVLATTGSLLLGASLASAASIASDNGANAPYTNNNNLGWLNGTNGGTGFGAWTFSNTAGGTTNSDNDGEFIGNSGNNGGGNPNGNGGGIGNPAFGLYSGSANTASATRAFTGSLSVGQTFSLQMDNGYINPGGQVGFRLLTTSGGILTLANPRFQFYYVGGSSQNSYQAVGDSTQYTNAGFTDNGLSVAFTLTDTNAYSLSVTISGAAQQTITGTLGGTADSAIAGFQLFSTNVGTGGANDAFFNTLAVTGTNTVPEPTTYVWLGASLLGLIVLRARRRAA